MPRINRFLQLRSSAEKTQFNDEAIETVKSSGISPSTPASEVHGRTALRNLGVGTCRRDLLDHVLVLNRRHLKRLMNEYVLYYLEDRTHLALGKTTPAGREAMENSGGGHKVTSMSTVLGLHHRYIRAA